MLYNKNFLLTVFVVQLPNLIICRISIWLCASTDLNEKLDYYKQFSLTGVHDIKQFIKLGLPEKLENPTLQELFEQLPEFLTHEGKEHVKILHVGLFKLVNMGIPSSTTTSRFIIVCVVYTK